MVEENTIEEAIYVDYESSDPAILDHISGERTWHMSSIECYIS